MLGLNTSIFGREVPVGFGVMGSALISWAILKGTPSAVQGGLLTIGWRACLRRSLLLSSLAGSRSCAVRRATPIARRRRAKTRFRPTLRLLTQ
jgi:hypothetical protein